MAKKLTIAQVNAFAAFDSGIVTAVRIIEHEKLVNLMFAEALDKLKQRILYQKNQLCFVMKRNIFVDVFREILGMILAIKKSITPAIIIFL